MGGWALKNSCGNALYFPNEAFMEILDNPRLWLKPHWSSCALPVRVSWLNMTRAGQINHKRFLWSTHRECFFSLFLYDLNIYQNCYFSMSVTYLGTWDFVPKLLESKAVHFRDSDFAHLRGWENLFPSLPSRKSTSEGAVCKPFCRDTRESFFSCHLCGYKLILGEKLKVFCRILFLSVRVTFRLNLGIFRFPGTTSVFQYSHMMGNWDTYGAYIEIQICPWDLKPN